MHRFQLSADGEPNFGEMANFPAAINNGLQTRIDTTRSTTVGRIAGDIEEIALLLTFRACVRGLRRGDEKTALAAFPIRQPALLGRYPPRFVHHQFISAVSTSHFLLITFSSTFRLHGSPSFSVSKNVTNGRSLSDIRPHSEDRYP